MKRRKFLSNTSLVAIPGMLSGFPVRALGRSSLSQFISDDSDRVLVLVQLNGGNDGLSTIIPLDQQDNLAIVRSNIYIPRNQVLKISNTLGLHPSMDGIRSLYDNGKIKIVQDVGYPDQNRSHFRSRDIWHSGSNANEYINTGWLGRYFNERVPNFPDDYPNKDNPHPFALTVGSNVTETCEGLTGNFSMAVVNPGREQSLFVSPENKAATGCAKQNLNFLNKSINQTNEYSFAIKELYDKGNNLSSKYNDENPLAQKLKNVARLISGGIRSKVFVVSLGGFDTHSSQTASSNSTIGRHADLLKTVSDAIAAFQDDIQMLGLDQKILGMTYSEFGRRIRSNASFGTDHGNAAPLIMFGSCLDAGIVGSNTVIDRNVSQGEGVAMQFDFRSVYGSTLMDWFNVNETEVNTMFNHDFQYIPISNGCGNTSSTNDPEENEFLLEIRPNPSDGQFILSFKSKSEHIKISIFNTLGSEIKVLTNQQFTTGTHSMRFDLNDAPAAAYFVRIQNRTRQKTLRVIKQ